jgi:hypothetical protein
MKKSGRRHLGVILPACLLGNRACGVEGRDGFLAPAVSAPAKQIAVDAADSEKYTQQASEGNPAPQTANPGQMAQLVQNEMLPFHPSLLEPREFLVRFNHPAMRSAPDGGLPLSEVAAASLALTELVTSLLAANRSFGVDAVMPTVRVAAGSVDFFTTGPGVILGGLGVLAACGVGMISAPVIPGTVVLVSAIDLALNWQRRTSEKGKIDAERVNDDVERARADDKKIAAETIGQELENEIKRVRLGNLPAQAEAHSAAKPVTPPASFFVPFVLIERSSQENGLAAAHGVHLINRGLPSNRNSACDAGTGYYR